MKKSEKAGVKCLPPVLSESIAETEDINAYIASAREDLEHLHVKNETLEYALSDRLEFSGCIFEKCVFSPSLDAKFSFSDVIFKGCDLSNVHFKKSSFMRVSFSDCKAVGAVFDESVFRHVSFDGSVLRYAGFLNMRLENVRFQNSDLSNCLWEKCKLKAVQLKDSRLDSSEFSVTPLADIDLSGCGIKGISANLLDLKGAIIASHQAVDLAGILGVVITDNDL